MKSAGVRLYALLLAVELVDESLESVELDDELDDVPDVPNKLLVRLELIVLMWGMSVCVFERLYYFLPGKLRRSKTAR